MRLLGLIVAIFFTPGCGLFHSLERDTSDDNIIDTSDTEEVDSGDTLDTNDTVDTGDGPDDIFPTSGDYEFETNENFSDGCLLWGGVPQPSGEEAFVGNATVNPDGVGWVLDDDARVETQWVADNEFYGVLEVDGMVTEHPELDASMIMEPAWLGEWFSDIELVASLEITMRCEGRDCTEAEREHLEQTGVALPCFTISGVDGTLSR